MSTRQQRRASPLRRVARKYFVSAFVISAFAGYAIHERTLGASQTGEPAIPTAALVAEAPTSPPPTAAPPVMAAPPPPPPTSIPPTVPAATAPPPTDTPTELPTDAPTEAPTDAPAAQGRYKDGTYTGDVTDAYFGEVQVEAQIKGGKIVDVRFVDYPHDRRTSVRINTYATPILVEEAIQAQSAEVDIISGATLTSEAFVQSLQSALHSAKA